MAGFERKYVIQLTIAYIQNIDRMILVLIVV